MHGVDALRAWALRVADQVEPADADDPDLAPDLPDLVLFLGDQVYADETTDGDAGVHRVAARHRAAAVDRAAGLRGVRPPLPPGVVRPGQPVAALDRAERDDLRRPRHPRRLEHLAGVAPRDGGHVVVARPHRRRARVLLGLPAPRQPLAGRAASTTRCTPRCGRTPATTSTTSDRSSTPSPSGSTRSPQTYRWSYTRDFDTQARLVVVDSRAARQLDPDARALLDADEAAWLDEQLRGDVDHLLVGTSLPFLLARGLHHLEAFSEALAQGAWGERGGRLGEKLAPARRPRALGRVPDQLPGRRAPGDGGRRGGAGPRAVDGDVPVRRRPPQLRQRGPPGHGRPRRSSRRSSRRSARRSATRSRATCASRRPCCPTASPGRSGGWRRGRRRCPTRRSPGATPKGRGSTTTWRACRLGGPRPEDVVGHRRGGRRPRPAAAGEGGEPTSSTSRATRRRTRGWRRRSAADPAAVGGGPVKQR